MTFTADSSGDVYVGGFTLSTDFPLVSPVLSTPTGSFVAKLSASGSSLLFSTFTPGTGFSYPKAMAIDPAGALYVALGNDPSVSPMVLVYSPGGQQLGSLVGNGAGVSGIALRSDGKEAYLAGTWWPDSSAPHIGPLGGPADAFVASYAVQAYNDMALHNVVVFGGSEDEQVSAVVVDAQDNPIVAGFTNSPDFPLANPIKSTEVNGDDFLTRILFGSDMQLAMSGPATTVLGDNITYTLNATNLGPATAFSVLITDTLPAAVSFVSVATTQGTCSGGQTVTCTAQLLGAGDTVTVTIVAHVIAGGKFINPASVSTSVFDTGDNPANNTASWLTSSQYQLIIAGLNTTFGEHVTISPSGTVCDTECSLVLAPQTEVTLTASASKAKFLNWSGACTGTNPVCTLRMTTNLLVGATFLGF